MGLKNLKKGIRDHAETWAIGYVIHRIEAGAYGPKLQAFWLALKGYKSIIGWSVATFGGACLLFPSPEAQAFGGTLAIIGTYLGRLGLIAKGSDQDPPSKFPEEYREAAVFILSISTYICEALTLIGGLLLLSGAEKATTAAMSMVLIGQAISTATGYFSTKIGPTPAQSAGTALRNAVIKVEDARAEAVKEVEIATKVNDDATNSKANI